MKEKIGKLKPELQEMQKMLQGEAEVLRHMSCEQCLLKSQAEKLEQAAGKLKNWVETLELCLQQD